MKLSNYFIRVLIDEEKEMLYNTLSRQYYVYERNKDGEICAFIENLNKGAYTEAEIQLFGELLNKGIICSDEVNELQSLRNLENERKYCDNRFMITVMVTNACNFRCVYCTQEHLVRHLEDTVADALLKLITKKAPKVREIKIGWFGGEPLLGYERIVSLMREARKICEENQCRLTSEMTTNGYLLNEERVAELDSLSLCSMQITMDGSRDAHNTTRKLADGSGTYDKVLENILLAAKQGIRVTLRMNVSEENYNALEELLSEIPEEHRHLLNVSIANVFQNEEKISVYEILKRALELGYRVMQRKNVYASCHACFQHSVVVDTDGSLLLCTNAGGEKRVGYLDAEGNICMEQKGKWCRLKEASALDNPECRKCKELPLCVEGCNLGRMKSNDKCRGKRPDGMSVEERALLDYYIDYYENERKQQDVS